MAKGGTFAGKTVFGSTPSGPVFYLTQMEYKNGGTTLRLPGMSARTASPKERCILYVGPDGSLRIQMPSLLWISFSAETGWLMLTGDAGQAAELLLSGNPRGQWWEVRTAEGPKKIHYTVDNPSPILSILGDDSTPSTFAPVVITRSLDEIRQTNDGRRADLQFVDLTDEELAGVDFTGADLSNATADRTRFTDCTLVEAKFVEASLRSVRCDGSSLDRADMTRAKLQDTSWGSPKKAPGIVLTGCFARGATLGGQSTPLDCSGANLAGGDFREANLSGLLLNKAEAGGAILAECKLDKAVLDDAKLVGTIAVGASFQGASLRNVDAQAASFVRANFSGADLTRARMGAKAWLFDLGPEFAKELDSSRYVRPNLIAAFKQKGVELSPSDEVEVATEGKRWIIRNAAGPYVLALNAANRIDVIWASPDLRPAILRGAICRGTRASGANLAGADLRGVQWYSQPATLDHADLESAALSGSLLVQMDFTQAYLAGADLSDCVLVQASFKGCLLGSGENRRPFSLEGSMLQGADFTSATLAGALLTDAGVALVRGVPLFRLPSSAEQYLNAQDLAKLAPDFQSAGYPLGTGATISKSHFWLLDNRSDPTPGIPQWYRVRLVRGNLQVFDGDTGKSLFPLDGSYEQYLSRPTASPEMVAAFAHAGYSLYADAPISVDGYWEIQVGRDALGGVPVSYPTLRVYAGPSHLPVYAAVMLELRDWPQYPSLAFSATVAMETALNPASLGPSGYPRSWVDSGLMDWEILMTAVRGGTR